MAALSISEIRQHAANAGFTGDDLDIAVAVALAESGGDPKKHNPKPPDNSYGLWQINMLGDMGPERRKRFGLTSNDQLFDPATNARAAYSIFKTQGWEKGWTTYKSGKYKSFMPAIGIDGKPVNQDDDGYAGLKSAINSFGETVFKGAANFTGAMIAIALLGGGVILLVMSSKSARKAVSVAANVVPGGPAAKQALKKVAKP